MKNEEIKKQFNNLIETIDLKLSSDEIYLLLKYWFLLLKWNQKINLISLKGNFTEQLSLHLIDSLWPLKFIPALKKEGQLKVADLGSGGGLPAIPLKIVNPDWDYTLIESIHKKAYFLRDVGRTLKFRDYQILIKYLTAKNVQKENKYDLITARAVAAVSTIVETAANHLVSGGCFWLYKGPKLIEELKQAEANMDKAQIYLENIFEINLPLTNNLRYLAVLRKNK